MDQNTKDILDVVNFIKEKMVTKDDLSDLVRPIVQEEVRVIVREEVQAALRPIHSELAHINRRLNVLDEHYKNLKGVTKEIDDIRDRVRDIERHLGLDKKIAA